MSGKMTARELREILREAHEEARRWKFGLERDYENSWGGAFKALAPRKQVKP